MYLVTIKNNNIETIINHVSTSNSSNKITGTIKQGINTINSFTFTILPNNEGYSLIEPLSTLVKVYNTKTNKYEFIGRVLNLTNSMDSNGLTSKTYICESELAYLLDSYQLYKEIHGISVRGYLERLITAHNNSVDNNKRFKVGNVDVVDNNDSLYRYVSYDTTKKNIEDDLINKLGGELQIRYDSEGNRYLDYLTEIGEVCDTEIRLGRNLQDIEQNADFSGYCNRLIPLGAKLKAKDSEGNEVDTEERLTISSVNNGLNYIDDSESIAKYGVIQGQVIYDDVTKADNLLSKGNQYLLNQRLSISNKVNALDLSLIDIDVDSFEVGNKYPLIHEILGINNIVRVVEKSITIENPQNTSITLDSLEKDIKQYNIKTKKGYSSAIKLIEEASSKITAMEFYTNEEIYRIDGNINTITSDVDREVKELKGKTNQNASDIEAIKEEISNINKQLKDILDMEYYLQNECYCPGEIYSFDGFFYQIFDKEDECEYIGEVGKECVLTNFDYSLIAVVCQQADKKPKLLMICHKDNKIGDIVRVDATENNIKLIKEIIKNNKSNLKWNEYEEGSTAKALKEVMSIADAIMID